MPTVREQILSALRNDQLDASSPLTTVPYIGPYIERRLRYSIRREANALTVGDVWRATRRRSTNGVLRLLYRALQNERGNQCVATRVRGDRGRRKAYHAGDINQHGYEAMAALLEYRRANAVYGPLPVRFPARAQGSKRCGCHSLRDCNVDAACRISDNGSACVPRIATSNGFVGVIPHQSQREDAENAARVRRASRIRTTAALRSDPDSAQDLRARRSRRMSYSRRNTRLWRKPSSRVRHRR